MPTIFGIMLQQLHIENYVIIDQLLFTPQAHLNIITGETGAGKSILLGALGLVLGERADAGTLFNKEKKCVVEAYFDVRNHAPFAEALAVEEIDYEPECIIRREISATGKSRAFINDTPVTITVLQRLTSLLVDMHQQFGHLALKEDRFQMDVLDAIADNSVIIKTYQEGFLQYQKRKKQLESIYAEQRRREKERAYNIAVMEELEAANFKENELEDAANRLKQLSHSEQLLAVLEASQQSLSEGEMPLINELKKNIQQLQTIEKLLPDLSVQINRLNSIYEELKDVSGELQQLASNVSLDPETMNALQERLDVGYRLLKKHGLQETNELIALHQQMLSEAANEEQLTSSISQLQKECDAFETTLLEQAQQLSQNRHNSLPDFEVKMNELLGLVGMPNARYKVELQPTAELTQQGRDQVQFLFDANKSKTFTPLYKAASGGEMSRIMLCIKSLTAAAMQMPTLIFDEVDTGISGESAKQVSILLKNLSQYHQVLCITHLPQVAAKSDAHYYVYKETVGNRVTAQLRTLNDEEHLVAIAQMMDGENPSNAALQNAKELIQAL